MRFSKEQFKALSPYEKNFLTAVRSDWTASPGLIGLQTIHKIYCEVTGDKRRLNANCSHCIMSLVKDCGRLYLADKEERAKIEQSKAKVSKVSKVSIKTAKTEE